MQGINFDELKSIHTFLNGPFIEQLNDCFQNICNNYETISREGLSSETITENLQQIKSQVNTLSTQANDALDEFNSRFNSYIQEQEQAVQSINNITSM